MGECAVRPLVRTINRRADQRERAPQDPAGCRVRAAGFARDSLGVRRMCAFPPEKRTNAHGFLRGWKSVRFRAFFPPLCTFVRFCAHFYVTRALQWEDVRSCAPDRWKRTKTHTSAHQRTFRVAGLTITSGLAYGKHRANSLPSVYMILHRPRGTTGKPGLPRPLGRESGVKEAFREKCASVCVRVRNVRFRAPTHSDVRFRALLCAFLHISP
ncbi:Hypothetical predicted protein [Olea europaea subsp. europaea]|uniref:Uncharacterized protein n=1 Tax=Olea europaea subsp. europaea TaxID=158383 RepID=A0A8S0SFP2_OLEEU|nr:Hypothetical predicted protein [Olea europaea subsp. europaea]